MKRLFILENNLQTIFRSLYTPAFLRGTGLFGKYCMFVISALILVNVFAAITSAATFGVINLNDSGAGSFRQAIIDANSFGGDDTIIFQNGLSGIVTLTSGEFAINSNISIIGLTGNLLTVERSAVSGTLDFRIFNIAAGANVSISNLIIKGGRLSTNSNTARGGGINNVGTLNLIDAIITGNSVAPAVGSAQTSTSGGGIYNTGVLLLTNCVVSNNSSISASGSRGGGIANTFSGNLTLINTKIIGNGATANRFGATNSGGGLGGGIDNAGTADFTNVSISNNTALGRWAYGAGINNSGNLTITNTTVSNNVSTGSSNDEAQGGGIRSNGTLTLTNSTVSRNTATEGLLSRGGGLFIGGPAFLKSATITANTVSGVMSTREGGGIFGGASLFNTIVAENTGAFTSVDISGAISSQGNNLIGNTAGSSGWISSDLTNQPARLAGLGDNGGTTLTVALLPDSPAINAGNNANAAATDQRGLPRIIGGTIDIGAFEVQPALQFSAATYTVNENGGTATITVSRTGGSTDVDSVQYATSNGTATGGASCGGAGIDYQTASGTLTFAVGVLSQTFNVTICDDVLVEGDETVNLALSNAIGTTLGIPNTAVLTIVDNEMAPTPTPTPTPRRTQFDFDGDGRADLSVFRPSDGVWYLLNSQSGFTSSQFGISTDRLAPADYDGDGRTDIAVYRDGVWYLLRSSLGFIQLQFGIAEDIPQPADFDGDGRAELVVYRPSNGTWYVFNLFNNQFFAVQFGISTDKPVVGDYDGDNRADYAVYRPSEGVWYLLRSTAGFTASQFGIATDRPTAGDYDGDGRTDLAVYRPSEGVWYLLRSTAGFTATQFGISTDLPTPADYDGDGRTDLAVYRPAEGVWYLLRSTQGFTATQFGLANDKPIPNAFVPQ